MPKVFLYCGLLLSYFSYSFFVYTTGTESPVPPMNDMAAKGKKEMPMEEVLSKRNRCQGK